MTLIFFDIGKEEDNKKIIDDINKQRENNPILKGFFKYEAGILPIAKYCYFQIKCYFSIFRFPEFFLKAGIRNRCKKLELTSSPNFFTHDSVFEKIIEVQHGTDGNNTIPKGS